MPIKYFCDVCGVEMPEPYSIYTTGKMLCWKHLQEFHKEQKEQIGKNWKFRVSESNGIRKLVVEKKKK